MEFKSLGSAYYEEGQYDRSKSNYRSIIIYLDYLIEANEKEEKMSEDLRVFALQGICLCNLKLGNFREAVKNCNEIQIN